MALPKSVNRFSKTLHAEMAARGVNAAALATLFGVRHQRFYTWANGQCLPPKAEAARIGQLIGQPDLVDVVVRLRRRRARARARVMAL